MARASSKRHVGTVIYQRNLDKSEFKRNLAKVTLVTGNDNTKTLVDSFKDGGGVLVEVDDAYVRPLIQ